MTWSEFKEAMRKIGVRDTDEIRMIDVMWPTEIEVGFGEALGTKGKTRTVTVKEELGP